MQVIDNSLYDKMPLLKLLNVNEEIEILKNKVVKELLLF